MSLSDLYRSSLYDPRWYRIYKEEILRRFNGDHPWKYAITKDSPSLAYELLHIPTFGCGSQIIGEALRLQAINVIEEIYHYDRECFLVGLNEYLYNIHKDDQSVILSSILYLPDEVFIQVGNIFLNCGGNPDVLRDTYRHALASGIKTGRSGTIVSYLNKIRNL